MAWYRKYRPQRIADLQIVPVREQLLQTLANGKISHAYLFAGPKGTGKTSTARILARVLNDPANEKVVLGKKGKLSEPDPDSRLLQKIAEGHSEVVLELDAASHRGIDDVRRLQEMVSVVPTEGLIRVVILDEVHMLTNEAFNALLKLLEEPPERVVFILATTELQKVPATIQSRCELIPFRRANSEEIGAALQMVANAEKIDLSKEISLRIAEAAQGSFRDAVKYLEQVARGGAMDEKLLDLLTIGQQQIEPLLRALAARDPKEVAKLFQESRQKGENFVALEQALVLAVQERLHRAIQRGEKSTRILIELLSHLAHNLGGPEPIDGIKLEVACLTWCLTGLRIDSSPTLPQEESIRNDSSREKVSKESILCAWEVPSTAITLEEAKQQAKQEKAQAPVAAVDLRSVEESELVSSELVIDRVQQAWPQLLLAARTKSQALESIIKQGRISGVKGATIQLEFELGFHKEQLETKRYHAVFLELLAESFGRGVTFAATVLPPAVVSVINSDQSQDSLVQAVEAAVLSLG